MTPPLRRASSAPARLGRNNRMSPSQVNRLALMLANMSLHVSPMNVNNNARPMNINNPRRRRRSPTVRRSPGGARKRARR